VADGPDPDDPMAGLAPERTELAWDRSGLAVVVSAAVLARRVWPVSSPERLLAVAAISAGIAIWATVLLLATRRGRPGPRSVEKECRRVLVATLVFAAAGFTIGFFPPTA